MQIEVQNTPDKNVINFFPKVAISKSNNAEFADSKTLRKSPLAERIFDIGGIKSVFINKEMISVTKEDNASWDDLKALILAELMEFLSTGEEVIIEKNQPNSPEEIIQKILGLLDARIRPAVKQDGGDIKFKKYEDGIVYVEMCGACAGCPYALHTLKEGVEKIIKSYIPEVKSVENYEK